MKNNITTVLETILSNIQATDHQPTSSPSAQNTTEPDILWLWIEKDGRHQVKPR